MVHYFRVRRLYPNLILNVFDLPSVIVKAKSKISHLGDKSKIKLIPGNFIEDKLPDGNDIIFLNRVLYDHNDKNVELLIKKHDALSPGGHLVTSEPMAGNEKPTRSGDAYFGFYNSNDL